MKKMKKIFALLIAIIMVFSMGITVFAEGEESGETTAKVTVTIDPSTPAGATNAPTYTYYVMMKASVGEKGTSYYVESEELATALDNLKIGDDDLFTVKQAAGANRWNVTINEKYKEDGENVAKALQTIKGKAITTGTASDNKIELDYDAYLLIESSLGTNLVLNTVTTKELKEKNTYPSVGKTEDKTNAEIGQAVAYSVSVNIPENVAAKAITITDTMTKGLTMNTAVTVEGAVSSPEYTSATWAKDTAASTDAAAVYTITIPAETVKANAGKTLVFKYSATVNENAVINVAEKNKAKISYDNFTSKDTPDVEVKTFGFDLMKTDGTNALAGVKFTLQNSTNEYYTEPSNADSVDEDRFVATKSEVTTPANGKISFAGLAAGTYTLTETETLDGFNMLTGSITVKVADDGTVTFTGDGQTAEGTTVTVVNQSGAELPSTGGIGTTIFYIVGAALVIGAAFVMITRRRMDANK